MISGLLRVSFGLIWRLNWYPKLPVAGNVEVRDSGTGYFIPVRYGMGLGQMEKLSARRRRRRRRDLENAQI